MVETDGSATTVRLSAFVAVSKLAAVTSTVKLLVPDPEGVPEITPPELRFNPVGKVPDERDQV